jgi:hypothetical protein
MTGPTYAVKGVFRSDVREMVFRLPRMHAGAGDAEIRLPMPDQAVGGTLGFRRFRSHDAWSQQPLQRSGDLLIGRIPHQPPAGKVMYRVLLGGLDEPPIALTGDPVIIRFRGDVPAGILVAHVVVIFAGMFLSTRAGLEALCKRRRTFEFTVAALSCLVVGGLILGPVVQKYAFDAFWTGWPSGHDLTDNKIAVVVFFWLVALWRLKKRRSNRTWPVVAALITLTVWLIPHSLLGSELDYTQMPQ